MWERHAVSGIVGRRATKMKSNNAVSVLHRSRLAKDTQIKLNLQTGSLRDKQWWSTIKHAEGEGRSSDIPLLTENGREYHISQSKANCLAEYFAGKCSLGNSDLTLNELPEPHSPPYRLLNNAYFRKSTVQRSLAALEPSKATGPDGIPARVLKECSAELSSPLARLFSLCFHAGVQPSDWKLANVVPIHKRSSRA